MKLVLVGFCVVLCINQLHKQGVVVFYVWLGFLNFFMYIYFHKWASLYRGSRTCGTRAEVQRQVSWLVSSEAIRTEWLIWKAPQATGNSFWRPNCKDQVTVSLLKQMYFLLLVRYLKKIFMKECVFSVKAVGEEYFGKQVEKEVQEILSAIILCLRKNVVSMFY